MNDMDDIQEFQEYRHIKEVKGEYQGTMVIKLATVL